jgi:hypothetical protein
MIMPSLPAAASNSDCRRRSHPDCRAITRICATSSSAGAREAGCAVEIDPVGNIFGRRPRTDHSLPPVAIGSHLDTQICGGQYDGVLGVMCGLEAIRTLNDRAVQTSATKPLPMIRDDHRKPLASYSAPWTARSLAACSAELHHYAGPNPISRSPDLPICEYDCETERSKRTREDAILTTLNRLSSLSNACTSRKRKRTRRPEVPSADRSVSVIMPLPHCCYSLGSNPRLLSSWKVAYAVIRKGAIPMTKHILMLTTVTFALMRGSGKCSGRFR